jgi:hypothetical protein
LQLPVLLLFADNLHRNAGGSAKKSQDHITCSNIMNMLKQKHLQPWKSVADIAVGILSAC